VSSLLIYLNRPIWSKGCYSLHPQWTPHDPYPAKYNKISCFFFLRLPSSVRSMQPCSLAPCFTPWSLPWSPAAGASALLQAVELIRLSPELQGPELQVPLLVVRLLDLCGESTPMLEWQHGVARVHAEREAVRAPAAQPRARGWWRVVRVMNCSLILILRANVNVFVSMC
jgi:hypothetical protein